MAVRIELLTPEGADRDSAHCWAAARRSGACASTGAAGINGLRVAPQVGLEPTTSGLTVGPVPKGAWAKSASAENVTQNVTQTTSRAKIQKNCLGISRILKR